MAPAAPDPVQRFVTLSAELTGFDAAELWGTGMAPAHFATLTSIVGADIVGSLLEGFAALETAAKGDSARLESLIETKLLPQPTLGPLARNLINLWYLGQWFQLPPDWRDVHGANANDRTAIVSAEAYTEGLVWPAIHSHPQGAKQPGYGSWSLPPENGRAP